MTDQEINIAIAEWCGWKRKTITVDVWHYTDYQGGGEYRPTPKEVFVHDNPLATTNNPEEQICREAKNLPNYCTDLNAMHDVECKLGGCGQVYETELVKICDRDGICIWSATARQRAEALLRTIGRWTE